MRRVRDRTVCRVFGKLEQQNRKVHTLYKRASMKRNAIRLIASLMVAAVACPVMHAKKISAKGKVLIVVSSQSALDVREH